MRVYKFESDGNPILPEQCTTPWPDTIKCEIPIGGLVGEKFYNIMKLDGPETDILNWESENSQVTLLTDEEANTLGRLIIPPGTESERPDGEVYVAGTFDIVNGLVWTLK